MNKLPLKLKNRIDNLIENSFDRIAIEFLGKHPKIKNKKALVFSSKPNYNLGSLLVHSMNNQVNNKLEESAIKTAINSAFGYIETLKNKTKNEIISSLEDLLSSKKENITENQIENLISDKMSSISYELKRIVQSESNKSSNLGTAMQISRVSSSAGVEDPNVFFVINRANPCEECLRVHTEPNGNPRVFKLSEVKSSYHKRGENTPSFAGLHPHCSCFLNYLAPGFGFKNGKVSYIKPGYDAYSKK